MHAVVKKFRLISNLKKKTISSIITINHILFTENFYIHPVFSKGQYHFARISRAVKSLIQ